MLLCELLNLQARHFTIQRFIYEQEVLIILMESHLKRCRCPLCHKYSHSIHSRYERHLKDLPCFANKTCIQLRVHKFYCHNPHCPQKIFTERFAADIAPYKRMTDRLCKLLFSLSLQLSSRSAERICKKLSIEISDTTLARLLQKQPLSEPSTPKVLGVDDWALKKGNQYGTVLVDLEHHKIIDLLEDRETPTLQKWLAEHPEVQIVSRDRYSKYSNAISAALPCALQVVDRWHLLKNLCERLHKLVERNHQHLKYARIKEIERIQRAYKKQRKKAAAKGKVKTVNYSLRVKQLKQIKKFQSQGVAIKAMARALHMSRHTIKKYLHLQELPRRRYLLQVNIGDFDTYIRKRLKEKPDIPLVHLYREIKQIGYNGGRSSACLHLNEYVNRTPRHIKLRLPDVFYLPAKTAYLLLRRKELLSKGEQILVAHLCSKCPQIKTASALAIEFKEIMENKKGGLLKRWIEQAVTCGIREVRSFAKGLLGDFEAVKNAVTMPWSNGQVEGQINKLKTIKRLMYGRASFELLRKKLLLDSS